MVKLSEDILREMLNEVIISRRNGKLYLKRKPKKVRNPRTEGQKNQRGKFRAASIFVSKNLHQLIRPYWNPEAKRQGMTGQNLFCKINTHAFDGEGKVNVLALQATVGNLGGIDIESVDFKQVNRLTVNWKDNSRDKKTSKENLLKVLGLQSNLIVEELECKSKRSSKVFTVEIEKDRYTHLYLFFWNDALEIASKGEWIEI